MADLWIPAGAARPETKPTAVIDQHPDLLPWDPGCERCQSLGQRHGGTHRRPPSLWLSSEGLLAITFVVVVFGGGILTVIGHWLFLFAVLAIIGLPLLLWQGIAVLTRRAQRKLAYEAGKAVGRRRKALHR